MLQLVCNKLILCPTAAQDEDSPLAPCLVDVVERVRQVVDKGGVGTLLLTASSASTATSASASLSLSLSLSLYNMHAPMHTQTHSLVCRLCNISS